MKNNYSTFFSAIVLSLILQGCLDTGESDREQQIKEDNEIIQAYLDANDIEAEETSSGVYYEVLEENEQGKQVVQDHVVGIRYTMKHLSGEQEIESNIDSLAPLRF
ncbi:MAG: hypothetical protein WD491_07840, partial [Balneolales bacterium]